MESYYQEVGIPAAYWLRLLTAILVSEFKLQSCYYVHLLVNIHGEGLIGCLLCFTAYKPFVKSVNADSSDFDESLFQDLRVFKYFYGGH